MNAALIPLILRMSEKTMWVRDKLMIGHRSFRFQKKLEPKTLKEPTPPCGWLVQLHLVVKPNNVANSNHLYSRVIMPVIFQIFV